jgi:hypothetical protein
MLEKLVYYFATEHRYVSIFVIALFIEVSSIVRGRLFDGIPKGPKYSVWYYEYWYGPNRNLSNRLFIFFAHALLYWLILVALLEYFYLE